MAILPRPHLRPMGELRPIAPWAGVSQPGLESRLLILQHSGEAPTGLTQASQHDSNGAEVGKSTEGIRCEDLCSDLKIQKTGEEGVPSDGTGAPDTI